MRYSDPKLLDSLAFEYVVGTLGLSARRRFESLMKYRIDIRQRVAFWEQQFLLNVDNAEAIAPPPSVWRSIETRLNDKNQKAPRRPKHWFWLAATNAAALILLVAGLGLWQFGDQIEPAYAPDHVGLLGDQAQPLWVISANLQTGVLEARAVTAAARSLDEVYELWMLPNSGQPQSIGLLPVNGGRSEHVLPAGLMALLRDAKGLAVSIEPEGGSPTGLPTGEVIQTTKIWEL